MNKTNIDILVIEDNPGDALLLKEAIKIINVFHELYIVKDGEEAMNFLYRKAEYEQAPRPDLIFLDLNLPKKDGREVLFEIKSKEELKQIPVVVLTSSQREEDISICYSLHANSYLNKPIDLDQFFKIMKLIEEYWFTLVKLPGKYKID